MKSNIHTFLHNIKSIKPTDMRMMEKKNIFFPFSFYLALFFSYVHIYAKTLEKKKE